MIGVALVIAVAIIIGQGLVAVKHGVHLRLLFAILYGESERGHSLRREAVLGNGWHIVKRCLHVFSKAMVLIGLYGDCEGVALVGVVVAEVFDVGVVTGPLHIAYSPVLP